MSGPLQIGQVSVKSHLPSRKIYLSQMTGWDFFQALHKLKIAFHGCEFWTFPHIELPVIFTEVASYNQVCFFTINLG